MLTENILKDAFRIYLNEIDSCRKANCYWALLHILVVLPDICAALESSDGYTTGQRYKSWCIRHLTNPLISTNEYWEIRCKVLHQGKTLSSGRYRAYTFRPDEVDHYVIKNNTEQDLAVNVGRLAQETLNGLKVWFETLTSSPGSIIAMNVENNLPSLVYPSPYIQSISAQIGCVWTMTNMSTSSR